MTTTPTPRTNALTSRMASELDRPILAADHFIELCDFARQLERENAALRAALRELVACNDLHDLINALECKDDAWTDGEHMQYNEAIFHYTRRAPLAWTAARALVEPQ